MKKVIGLEIQDNIEFTLFNDLCRDIFSDVELEMHSGSYVVLTIEVNEIFLLKTLKSHLEDNGFNVTGVISYLDDDVLSEALNFAKIVAANQILHLADIVLLESVHQKHTIIQLIDTKFKGVSFDYINTAQAFIEQACNALLASEVLYIHRNTFSYRLNKFIDQTSLDIRDFHNARLFQSWLTMQHFIK